MDVSRTRVAYALALAGVVALGLVLRLHGIHNPILDHPGWRQGDTAAIARNFATLDLNPFHPQTDYDGPPPNYVELELQIVPFLAALLYRVFGVHIVFGRLISIGFSLATIVTLGSFARWMFASRVAGIIAALAFALFPGSVYYGRTFMPDTTMTFFLTTAVYAAARWIVDDEGRAGRRFALAVTLMALAILAKPVALVGFVPIFALLATPARRARALRSASTYAFVVLAIAPYLVYDRYVASIAEWHWASGITRLHVLPDLRAAFVSAHAAAAKLWAFRHAFGMLRATMLGNVGLSCFVTAAIATTVWRLPMQSRALLWSWLAAVTLYAYVVVTVERVDYYLYPWLPLAALWTGGLAEGVRRAIPPHGRRPAAIVAGAIAIGALFDTRAAIGRYYTYNTAVYHQARTLAATLEPGTLVVMGHYDPSILYYIGHKGWEEDPLRWTPFDEESAIHKGARYFIAIERNRLDRNAELRAWLSQYRVLSLGTRWPVYETDPRGLVPGARARWRAFRARERAGRIPRATAGARPPVRGVLRRSDPANRTRRAVDNSGAAS